MDNESPEELLTLLDAIKRLARLDMRPGDSERTAEDRWRKRITQALKNKKLPGSKEAIGANDLFRWAHTLKGRRLHPSFQSRLPPLTHPIHISYVEYASSEQSASMCMTSFYAFDNPEEANNELNRLSVENSRLRAENARLRSDLAMLRPKAEKYDRQTEKNRANARRPRGPREPR